MRDGLQSIRKHLSSHSSEVIHVENGSADGNSQMLKQDFPGARAIWNNEHLSFAKASNQTILSSNSSFARLVNSDSLAMPGAPDALLDCGVNLFGKNRYACPIRG